MSSFIHTVETRVPGAGSRSWDVLRLDLLHPVVSGNKPFKLHGYVRRALGGGFKGLLTFGGYHSNHIHATAHAAACAGLSCIGVIRGVRPGSPSPTLADAERMGMRLVFMGRSEYRAYADSLKESVESLEHPGFLVVPEGGSGETGVEGASLIHGHIPRGRYDTILCACGTGTTMAGLVKGAEKGQRVAGVSVLMNDLSLESRVHHLAGAAAQGVETVFMQDRHFGGYAKHTPTLIGFMNRFHSTYGLPSDFVYTGKLFHAAEDLFLQGFFRTGERVLCIHSGGLQGNRSLAEGVLAFR